MKIKNVTKAVADYTSCYRNIVFYVHFNTASCEIYMNVLGRILSIESDQNKILHVEQ